MKLIVTRPIEDTVTLEQKLESLGHEAVSLPLLTIVPRIGVSIPENKWQAICITSANAARNFVPSDAMRETPVIAIGEQSRLASLAAGYRHVIARGGDVPGLVAHVSAHCQTGNGPVLYLSGAETTGDLEGNLKQRGFAVHRAIVYDAVESEPEDASAKIRTAHGVLLYSPRTARLWAAVIAKQHLHATATRLQHYCLSANVARVLSDDWPRHISVAANETALLNMLTQVNQPAGTLAPAQKEE
jgi:uroporphyrinogen-III synthase